MRIGLVNEYFPPHAPGGAEWSAFYLGQRLAEAGHQVVVITPNYGAPAREKSQGMEIYRFPFPQKLAPGHLAHASLHGNPFFYLYSAFQIARLARREQLEVLHAQNVYSLPGVVLAARWLGLLSVVTLRDVRMACVLCMSLHHQDYLPLHATLSQCWADVNEFDRKYNRDRSLAYRLKWALNTLLQTLDLGVRSLFLQRADRIITISERLKEIYVRAGKFPAGRAHTIYNFPPHLPEVQVDPGELRRKWGLQDRKVILAVGKLSFGKGSHLLVEALPQVLQAIPQATLVFIGRENPLINIPPELQPAVRTLGVLPQGEVLSFYHLAEVVAFPAVGPEGQGRVLLEAMSLCRPVVASRVGGIPETVSDGETGLLVERSDAVGLARALVTVLSDPELARQMGLNGRRLLEEKFNPELILQQHLDVYRSGRQP